MSEEIQLGRPADVSKEDIINAGNELIKTNRRITGFALRKILGRGYAPRLIQIWEEYIATQSITHAEPVADLPIEVADTLNQLIKSVGEKMHSLAIEVNDRAVKTAEMRVSKALQAASEQRDQSDREIADAALAVEEFENQFKEEQTKVIDLEKRLSESQATNQAQAVELAKLRERLESIEKAAKAATEQHMIEQEQLRQSVADHKQSALTLTTERDQLKTELTKIQAKAEAADESHKEERKRAATEIQRSADKLIKLENERDNANSEAHKLREELARTNGQLEAMNKQFESVMSALTLLKQEPQPKQNKDEKPSNS